MNDKITDCNEIFKQNKNLKDQSNETTEIPEKTFLINLHNENSTPLFQRPIPTHKKNDSYSKLNIFFDKTRDVELYLAGSKPKINLEKNIDFTNQEHFPPIDQFYQKKNEFSAGGQGVLSLAVDKTLNRLVAIKSLRNEYLHQQEQRQSFISEAQLTAILDHPNIVPIYSLNSDPQEGLHLSMKLINGETLKSYLTRVENLYKEEGIKNFNEQKSLIHRLNLFLQVCDALEYAHNQNIMHCDLKPENIMIGEYHETYLMDWGLAHPILDKDHDPDLWVKVNKINGTPRYLSPEGVNGDFCDARADIYTMGLILFEITTLKKAFSQDDTQSLLADIHYGNMNPVTHAFNAYINKDLKAIILKATAYQKEDRYQTIFQLSTDLRRFLQGEEVSAKKDNFIEKTVRYIGHHKYFVFIMILIISLAWISTTVFSLYREIDYQQYIANKDAVISAGINKCENAALLFEQQFAKDAKLLSTLAAEISFLLSPQVSIKTKHPIYFYEQPKNSTTKETDFIFSPIHQQKVNYKAIGVHFSQNTQLDTSHYPVIERIDRFSIMISRFNKYILKSTDTPIFTGNQSICEFILNDHLDIVNIYAGFEDGLFLDFPAEKKSISKSYDHKKREWYIKATHAMKQQVIWTPPYTNIHSDMGLIISAVTNLYDTQNKKIGVLAADILLSNLKKQMDNIGNAGHYVYGKFLLDDENKIIEASSSVKEKSLSPSLIHEIRSHTKGFIIKQENERSIIYFFGILPCTNWIYIEQIDLDKMLYSKIPQMHTNEKMFSH